MQNFPYSYNNTEFVLIYNRSTLGPVFYSKMSTFLHRISTFMSHIMVLVKGVIIPQTFNSQFHYYFERGAPQTAKQLRKLMSNIIFFVKQEKSAYFIPLMYRNKQ